MCREANQQLADPVGEPADSIGADDADNQVFDALVRGLATSRASGGARADGAAGGDPQLFDDATIERSDE